MDKISKANLINSSLSLALKENTERLLNEILRVDNTSFTCKLEPVKSSTGGIAEHLLRLNFLVILNLNTTPEQSARDPQEKIESIIAYAPATPLELEISAVSLPAFIGKDTQEFLKNIILSRSQLHELTTKLDLTMLFPASPHPIFGILSGIEWINFLIHRSNLYLSQLGAL